MLSFYEMNRLLEKAQKATKKLNEAAPTDVAQRLAAIIAKRKGQAPAQAAAAPQAAPAAAQPVTMEPPLPEPAATPPAAPAQAAAPVKKGVSPAAKGERAPIVADKADINDPTRKTYNPRLRGAKGGAIAPAQSHQMAPYGTDNKDAQRSARLADKLAKFNSVMQNYPTMRWLTAIELQKLKRRGVPIDDQGQVDPNVPFVITTKGVKGFAGHGKDMKQILVSDPAQLVEIMNNVRSFFGGEAAQNKAAMATMQKIIEPAMGNLNLMDLVGRALEFQRALPKTGLQGKQMPLQDLAKALAAKSLSGGTSRPDPLLDVQALAHLIKTTGNELFQVQQGGDPKNPMVTVGGGAMGGAPAAAAGDQGAALKAKVRAMAAKRKQAPAGGAAPATPTAESNGWAEIMGLMEHWGF